MPPGVEIVLSPRQRAIYNALFEYYNKNKKTLGVSTITSEDLMRAVQEMDKAGKITLNDQGQISADAMKSVWEAYGSSSSTTHPGGSTIPPWPGAEDGGMTAAEKAAKENARKNRLASYENLVSMYGLDASGNISSLIELAAQKGWNSQRFINALRDTPQYQSRFVGMFDENGNPKMSESAYLAQEQRFNDIAKTTGINIGPSRLGYLFNHDVSPSEFAQRADALVKVQNNPALFKQFGATLKRENLVSNFTHQDAFRFVMGESPKEFYNVWNQAQSRYAATEAGIHLGKNAPDSYTKLSGQTAEKISRKGLSPEALAQGYQQLAKDLQNVLPLSRISKFGLSKQDLVELEFGGSRQAAVAQKVQQILRNEEAFKTNRTTQATTNLGQRGANQRA